MKLYNGYQHICQAQHTPQVEPSLRAWLSLGDCRGCLEQIRSVCSLHLATPGVQNPDGGNGVVVQDRQN